MSGAEEPDDATYEVGYGRPPPHTRYKKGVSGNPNGRPRKRKLVLKRQEQIDELFLSELERTVTVTENGKRTKIPLIVAMQRQLIADAAKGNWRARELVMRQTNRSAHRRGLENERLFESLVDQKLTRQAAFRDAERRGVPPPPILPHPDDIIIDVRNHEARIVGPITGEEHALFDEVRRLQAEAHALIEQAEDLIEEDDKEALAAVDWDKVVEAEEFFGACQQQLPPSLRWKDGKPPSVATRFMW